ncbi:glycoside hydrolase family 2 TIM barrel-domain containing protein [Echinicola jeungdonensis]|uniref:Glycoside hydrolase family 2 protein n=1 Tax=Echinicola jeungdonensis TaxID=709343 RepID=A0ABV5J8M1_9BACT|nr:sugar-binding domain-containing protein [Echinicola jeungdonensis]MDN3670356.1 glycoside hydrolase family 2 TIM barrel-domain containing protein [Echinicola jeungdonensis]
MKNILLILILLCASTTIYAQNQSQNSLSLDGEWSFIIDSTAQGINKNWHKELPAAATQVKVPHTWNTNDATADYAGLAWYQKKISIPDNWENKTIRIQFEAVYHDATVYVNGQEVGKNLNAGYTPFSFDITDYLKTNQSNTLVVAVDNSYSDKNLPYLKAFDWTNDGGIIRSVALETSGKYTIRYVHVKPELNLRDSTGTVKVEVKLFGKNNKTLNFNFSYKDKQSGKSIATEKIEIEPVNGIYTTNFDLGEISPWHFDAPNLYELETSITAKDEVSDTDLAVFGFKKVEIKGEKLYLNGEAVRLPGIEYMPGSNPKYGIAEPKSYMDSIVRSMKELNVVITRFHWQQDDYMISLMDKYGILVQEELPWWQKPASLTPELVKTAKKQLTDNIESHYNHPSIFSWGISNEINGSTDDTQYRNLRDYVKDLDATRFVTIVSNRIWQKKQDDPMLLGDMATWNEYIGTWHGNDRNELPGKLDTVKRAIGNQPLLITENGLCEPAMTGGDARRIDDMIFHIKEWSSHPWIMGYIYFSLNDYRTQMGEEGFGKYKIRRHGITDISLNRKPSFSVLKQLASPINITKVQRETDTSAAIALEVKASIPSYTLRGYILEYKNSERKLITIELPDLAPGDTYDTILENINPQFQFKVLRPTGFIVAQY